MKNLISFVVGITMLSNIALADCDYSKVISLPDGTYLYSKELHICVGTMKRDLGIAQQQITDLNQALTLKDLAIKKTEDRVNLWMDTTYKLEDRLNKIDELSRKNDWMYFGLGVVTTGLAVWGAGQLVKH